jgi:hypothetical protein
VNQFLISIIMLQSMPDVSFYNIAYLKLKIR